MTANLLAALCRHPNAGGVLVLSLGCENLTPAQFREALGPVDPGRVKFLVCQDVEDELAEGAKLLKEIAAAMAGDRREPLPVSKLVVGMKCGGSDGLSGITANPAVGRFSDLLVAHGKLHVEQALDAHLGGQLARDVAHAADQRIRERERRVAAGGIA